MPLFFVSLLYKNKAEAATVSFPRDFWYNNWSSPCHHSAIVHCRSSAVRTVEKK